MITRDDNNEVLYWDVETGLQLSELPPSASFNENEAIRVRQINGIHVEIDNNGVGFTGDNGTIAYFKGTTYFGYRDEDIRIWTTN